MSGYPPNRELGVWNPTGLRTRAEFLVRVVERRLHVRIEVDFGVFAARGKLGVPGLFAFKDTDLEPVRFDHYDLAVPITRKRTRLVEEEVSVDLTLHASDSTAETD
jgi:hypothetical protein